MLPEAGPGCGPPLGARGRLGAWKEALSGSHLCSPWAPGRSSLEENPSFPSWHPCFVGLVGLVRSHPGVCCPESAVTHSCK